MTTRRAVAVAVILGALGAPATAAAGFVLGARAGWAFPLGEVREGIDLSDVERGQIPLQLDLGWRFANQLMLGAYARYAPGVVGDNVEDACDLASVDCDGPFGFAFGAQLELALSPGGRSGPWIGAFGGFETLNYGDVRETSSVDFSYAGWEAGLQGGLDFAWGVLSIGPWVSASLARFTDTEADVAGNGVVVDIPDSAFHGWIQVGLRGALNL